MVYLVNDGCSYGNTFLKRFTAGNRIVDTGRFFPCCNYLLWLTVSLRSSPAGNTEEQWQHPYSFKYRTAVYMEEEKKGDFLE